MTNTEAQNKKDLAAATNLLFQGMDRAIAAIPEGLDPYLRMLPGQHDVAVELAAEAHFLRQYLAAQHDRLIGKFRRTA